MGALTIIPLVAVLLAISVAPVCATDQLSCAATKIKVDAKYGACLLKVARKSVLSGFPADYAKCDANFTGKWATTEAKYGVACPTVGDTAAVQSDATNFANCVVAQLSGDPVGTCFRQIPASGQTSCWDSGGALIACAGSGQDGDLQPGGALAYVDNGDGTVTDQNSGLMWEKLSDDDSVHDQDNSYTWAQAFAGKITTLNGDTFAGHNDWRLPSLKELQSIASYEIPYPGPTLDSAFSTGCPLGCSVTQCSCAQGNLYWSSTSYAFSPQNAWNLSFADGFVGVASKTSDLYVRAVRGGM